VDLDAQDVLDTWRNMSTASTSQKGWNVRSAVSMDCRYPHCLLQAIMTFRLFPFIDLLPLRAIKAQASVRERLHVRLCVLNGSDDYAHVVDAGGYCKGACTTGCPGLQVIKI
jgi:hypothetical protein